MAATVDVREINGAGAGTPTIVTAAKFCTADVPNPGTTNPIPIVAGQTKRSYWKSHELYLSGSYTQISNIYIYCDGAMFEAGITTYIGNETLVAASYSQATGTPGDTGDEMVTNHPGITAKTNLNTYVVGSPKLVDAGPYSTPPERTKHIVLQIDVADTATSGEKGPETATWRYDEV